MEKKHRRIGYLCLCLICFIILILFSCNDDDDGAEPQNPTTTPTYSTTPSPTPTFNPANCTGCHGFPPSSGKHFDHNGQNCCACVDCHASAVDQNNNLAEAHDNGSIDVEFAGGGTWDGSGCFGLSSDCHGSRAW
ncbi:hypothetical protein ACFL27_25100 [candidate division CSSED10-310 bacterium]|uniref:Uncharacterized protein n=1 Tax=candidate division CSSED10-310 bacterium TaxID=2855610 RepID=A0ABV6Z4V6_UNCC1